MKKEYLDAITDLVGVEPILINSALVSAQNRQRCYWTNLPVAGQPEDKGLVLKDILEPSVTNFLSETTAMRSRTQRNVRDVADKANALTATSYKGSQSNGVTVVKGGNQEAKIAEYGERWRVLTPLECERLQTVPDNYTEGVSNTQRYKMLGNGWTVDVICHILKGVDYGSN